MGFEQGNGKDGKHYWLTPTTLMNQLQSEWVLMLLDAGAKVRNLKDVKWMATEDGAEGPGTGRHIACFILDPENDSL